MKKQTFLLALLSIFLLNKVSAQITFQKTDKGVLYHNFTNNSGPKIKLNDVVTFYVVEKTEKDSVLYSSRVNKGAPEKIQCQPTKTIGDMMDVLPMLALNDSVMIKVPTDSLLAGHEDQRPPFFPKGSNLVLLVKIERIQSLDEALAERNAAMEVMKNAEVLSIKKYVDDSRKVYKTTASGLKYIITKPSIKRKALAGDTAYVNYTGHTLNGKVFDSSIQAVAMAAGLQQPNRTYEPIKVAVGQGNVIKGWDEALLLLNEGSKATLIIPSALAYGDQGAGETIPAYTPLVFDIELVKIKAVHHAVKKPAAKAPAKKTTVAKKK